MTHVVEALLICRQRRRLVALIFLINFIQSDFPINSAWAETWICPSQGQSDLYTDRGLLGCRLLGEPKTYSPLESSPAPRPPRPALIPPPVSSTNYPSNPSKSYSRPPAPFLEVSLTVPLLSVGQNNAGSITGSWGGFVAQLTVGYKADGKGPEILGDSNLMPVSAYSFHTAVMVATKAVGYDPRYLSVRILVPARLDGPSAGGIFAVGIAAALLGDPIRQDVCMSGTIEPDAVGRLVDKMSACRDLRKTTMIVPDALDNSHLNFTGAEKSIQVIEVHTFSEAYSAATGQALRQVP